MVQTGERYVVIRFQICIFDILNTAIWNKARIYLRCDSLSNLYLWHIKYSKCDSEYTDYHVVIRFQICIFDILNTAKRQRATRCICCDSLSNLYLWHIKYSDEVKRVSKMFVVIRFQICIFDILNTAPITAWSCHDGCDSLSNLYLWHIKYSSFARVLCFERLWFAFKFVSLTY